MTTGNSDPDRCVIVVGNPHSESAREMVRLAQEYQVRAVRCDDVYMAVAQMTAAGRRALIVGRIQDLARDNGGLLIFAAARGIRCGCLLETNSRAGREGIRAALRAGASLCFEMQEARALLEDWLTGPPGRTSRAPMPGLREEDLETTAAELGALLGQQSEA
jgi:hypothetical protein